MAEVANVAEAMRSEVKAAAGFSTLSADQSHKVLRKIAVAQRDTTATETSPRTLEMLSAGLKGRFEDARREALTVLDTLQTEDGGDVIVRMHIEVRKRVIGSAQDVDGLLAELEQRGGAIRVHLK